MSRWAAAVCAVVLAFAAVVLVAQPAAAHDELESSTPSADSTVESLPDELTLTFSGILATDAGATELAVTDAAGTSLASGAPVVQDNTVTQPLEAPASGVSGAVRVLWKVVSGDGHPISGEFAFTVSAPPAPTPTAEATPTAGPEPTPMPVETVGELPNDDNVAEDPNMTVDPFQTALVNPVTWLLVAAVAAIVIALVVRARRRRRANAHPESEHPADR